MQVKNNKTIAAQKKQGVEQQIVQYTQEYSILEKQKLEEYESICPGFAQSYLKSYIRINDTVLNEIERNGKNTSIALFTAIFLAISFVFFLGFLVYKEQYWVTGSILGSATIVTIISVFIKKK